MTMNEVVFTLGVGVSIPPAPSEGICLSASAICNAVDEAVGSGSGSQDPESELNVNRPADGDIEIVCEMNESGPDVVTENVSEMNESGPSSVIENISEEMSECAAVDGVIESVSDSEPEVNTIGPEPDCVITDETLVSEQSADDVKDIAGIDTEEKAEEEPEPAWNEAGCIICNVDINVDEPRHVSKSDEKMKKFFIEVMAVGQDIRLENENIFPFCLKCSEELEQLMGIGHKIDFMHGQFNKLRDSIAKKSIKTFLCRTKPELLEEDDKYDNLSVLPPPNRESHREKLFNRWKNRYELVQPGPKNPVMIRSMDSRGRVTVVRMNSKGESLAAAERYPKRGAAECSISNNDEHDFEEDHELAQQVKQEANIYKCPECPKTFTAKSMLAYHSRIHSGEFPFECEICGRGFAVPHYLITHMRSHTGEKPYKCDVCKKGFAQRGGLATHALVHSGAKPYACQLCEKSFRQKYHLTQHSLIHSGVKPFHCEICGKSFNVKMNLREHMRRHTGDRPYKCPYCTIIGFFRKKMLRDHISRIHPTRGMPEELLDGKNKESHSLQALLEKAEDDSCVENAISVDQPDIIIPDVEMISSDIEMKE